VTLSLCAPALFAQTVTTSADRAQLVQGQTQGPSFASDGVENGRIAASPNDADIGEQEIRKPVAQYLPFSAWFGTPIFYTSNVALTPNDEKGDVIFAPGAAVYYDPKITGTFYGHLGAREQIFYYGKYTTFDFGSLDCEAGLTYIVSQWHNLLLRGWYDFNRLTFGDRLGDEFFSNHGLILNAEVPVPIGRTQLLSIGADTNLSLGADHQSPRRNDYEGYLGYTVGLTPVLSVQAFGRFVARDYHQNGRTDLSEIVSGTVVLRVTDWCWISAIGSFAHSDSNQNAFDYNVGDAGGALEFSVRF
jgi:hypothetical protein